MATPSASAASLRAFGRKFLAPAAASGGGEVVFPAELLLQPLEDLRCPVCMDFPLAPWMLSCQHAFCKDCLDTHTRSGSSIARQKCPLCREQTVASMTSSRPMRAMMQSAGFRCFEPGCYWEGQSYDSARKHWTAECALVKAVREREEDKTEQRAAQEERGRNARKILLLEAENLALRESLGLRNSTFRALERKNQETEEYPVVIIT